MPLTSSTFTGIGWRSLAMVINIVDPDTLVFGGGLSNATAIYRRLLPLIVHYAFSDSLRTKLGRAVHGDSSGVRGAARLWPDAIGG
jgi:fructokinase